MPPPPRRHAQTCTYFRHAECAGLLHRAVYCWVFAPDGRLLVQRRSPHKKIGAGQLDLSVAEHLQPGEDYRRGAARGLAEELGIQVADSELRGPLAPTHRRELHQGSFHDVELVQSFRWPCMKGWCCWEGREALWCTSSAGLATSEGGCTSAHAWMLRSLREPSPPPVLARRLDGFKGSVSVDECEVAEAKWVSVSELRLHAEQHPEQYTPWFLEEIQALEWFGASVGSQQPAAGLQDGPQPGGVG